MDDLLDMMIADESPSQISDTIKDLLYAKAGERVDAFRPVIANGMFAGEDPIEVEDEVEVEVDDEELETSDGV